MHTFLVFVFNQLFDMPCGYDAVRFVLWPINTQEMALHTNSLSACVSSSFPHCCTSHFMTDASEFFDLHSGTCRWPGLPYYIFFHRHATHPGVYTRTEALISTYCSLLATLHHGQPHCLQDTATYIWYMYAWHFLTTYALEHSRAAHTMQ